MFPYDDNIPSIPSIPTVMDPTAAKNGPLPAYRRRNMLLRMISDPKCYHPRVLKSLCHEKRHRSDSAKQHFRSCGRVHVEGEQDDDQVHQEFDMCEKREITPPTPVNGLG